MPVIRYDPDARMLSLPYGELPLSDIQSALVARLIAGGGSCVMYPELFRAAWPNCWRTVIHHHGTHNIREQLHRVHVAARDLGVAALFANVRDIGFTWSPTELREE